MLPILAALASPPVSAHYPHDVAHWAAVSPDRDRPLLVTSLERIDMDILGRSEDGLTWEARLVPSEADHGGVRSGALLTPDRLVMASATEGLLGSEDAGDTILPVAGVDDPSVSWVEASPAVLDDGVAMAAGSVGVWRTLDAGLSWELVLAAGDEGFTDLDLSPGFDEDGRVCALAGAALACSDDAGDSWRWMVVPSGARQVAVGEQGRIWLAVRGQGLFQSDDAGESWTLGLLEDQDVTTVAALSHGRVFASEGMGETWRSIDDGESWTPTPLVTIPFDQSVDGVNVFDFFVGPEHEVYAAHWFGLSRSEDDGASWDSYDTERVGNAHSVVLTEGRGGDLWAWVGSYGGGPVLTELATRRSHDFPHLRGRFTRATYTSAHWFHDGVAVFDEGYDTYRTRDRGDSWEAWQEVSHEGEVTLANDVKGLALAPDTRLDPFVVLSVGQSTAQFYSSDDLGDHWIVGSQEPTCEAAGLAVLIAPGWPDDSRAWAACGGVVYESTDRGERWVSIGDTGAFAFAFAAEPDGGLLAATRDGLWRLRDGDVTRLGFDGAMVISVAAADDGTLFTLVPTQGWFRSDDGGASWVILPAPTEDLPRMVAVSPFFSEDGTVAVAGYGGSWVSTDRGEGWSDLHGLEIYESDHDAWRTEGDWSTASWPGASGERVVMSHGPGHARWLTLRGSALTLTAPPDAQDGVVSVCLDDGPAQEVTLPSADGIVWRVEGLDDAWHTLRIETVAGAAILDSVRVELTPGGDGGLGGALPADTGCRCHSAGRGAGLLALAWIPLLLWWRREEVRS